MRYVQATGEQQVWSYDKVQMQPDGYGNSDYAHAGSIALPQLSVGLSRPKPRAAVYALGEAASKTIGGSTSRVGADLSIPITPTASFYSTFHPDYSNVELDQQSIAPTVFAALLQRGAAVLHAGGELLQRVQLRRVSEHPGALHARHPDAARRATRSRASRARSAFATFDALGDDRNDIASALDFTSPDTRYFANFQRVSVNTPGLHDDVFDGGIAYSDLKHFSAYVNYGSDSGTNVLVPDHAQCYEIGGGWANQTFGFFGSTRKIGEYYNPADGFVSHPGIAGYALYSAKIWDFSANDKLESVGIAGVIDRYQGPTHGPGAERQLS